MMAMLGVGETVDAEYASGIMTTILTRIGRISHFEQLSTLGRRITHARQDLDIELSISFVDSLHIKPYLHHFIRISIAKKLLQRSEELALNSVIIYMSLR